jgi:hypothetical protein
VLHFLMHKHGRCYFYLLSAVFFPLLLSRLGSSRLGFLAHSSPVSIIDIDARIKVTNITPSDISVYSLLCFIFASRLASLLHMTSLRFDYYRVAPTDLDVVSRIQWVPPIKVVPELYAEMKSHEARNGPDTASKADNIASITLLRKIVEPCTLHYTQSRQQDIDDQLNLLNLKLIDNINGIARQEDVADAEVEAIPADDMDLANSTVADVDVQVDAVNGERERERFRRPASAASASSSGMSEEADKAAAAAAKNKRTLHQSTQLYLPTFNSHMDSSEFWTLISVVQSLFLQQDEKEMHRASK